MSSKLKTALAVGSDVLVAAGAATAGAAGAVVLAPYVVLNTTGSNRQEGEGIELLKGAVKQVGIGRRSDTSINKGGLGAFQIRFEHFAEYLDKVKLFLRLFDECNNEIGILPPEEVDEGGRFHVPVRMDVFWAFGAPGHMRIHSSLMVVYKSKLDGMYFGIKIDLQEEVKERKQQECEEVSQCEDVDDNNEEANEVEVHKKGRKPRMEFGLTKGLLRKGRRIIKMADANPFVFFASGHLYMSGVSVISISHLYLSPNMLKISPEAQPGM